MAIASMWVLEWDTCPIFGKIMQMLSAGLGLDLDESAAMMYAGAVLTWRRLLMR